MLVPMSKAFFSPVAPLDLVITSKLAAIRAFLWLFSIIDFTLKVRKSRLNLCTE